jgi:hypothetical protein
VVGWSILPLAPALKEIESKEYATFGPEAAPLGKTGYDMAAEDGIWG